MNFTEIKYERQDAIAYITLNRPAKLNALTEVMLEEWKNILHELEQDESCRIVIVKGEGKAWSAGVDLSVFQRTKVEPGYQMWQDGVAIMDTLERMPQVTIAMVNGYTFTGALEIMMAFDFVVAADEAKLGDTHSKWGIQPTWGMTQRLMQQVGKRKAKELSFTAEAISGTEAARIGLANKSVPLADLQITVDELTAKILGNSGQTIFLLKDLYEYGSKHSITEGLAYEANHEFVNTDKVDNLKNFKKEI